MLKLILVCTVLSFISISVESAKARPTVLVSYIPRCTLDETFNKCFVKNGNEVIPKLLNGDKKLGVPSFSPFRLNEVIFEPTNNLKMHFKNLKVSGFEDAKLLVAELREDKSQIYFELNIPDLNILADYETKGRILVLPFEGSGPCQIRLINGIYKITTTYENMAKESTGKLKLINADVDYVLDKTIYHFENLFNGNKRIGDETNRFLNENNADLYKDFKPAFSKTIETIATTVMNGILGNLHTTAVFNYP